MYNYILCVFACRANMRTAVLVSQWQPVSHYYSAYHVTSICLISSQATPPQPRPVPLPTDTHCSQCPDAFHSTGLSASRDRVWGMFFRVGSLTADRRQRRTLFWWHQMCIGLGSRQSLGVVDTLQVIVSSQSGVNGPQSRPSAGS